MARKAGVYICTGCSIGDSIDCTQLMKVAAGECKAAAVRIHPHLCGSEGRALVSGDLKAGGVDTVVIAACSPRVKTEAFSFNHGTVVERVNLREHVSWCQTATNEDTDMLAADYLRVGVARALKTEPPEPLTDQVSLTLLVVGGGVTGLNAALEAANAGYEVVLIEKQSALGGAARTAEVDVPSLPPYIECPPNGIKELIATVSYHSRIRVLTSAEILKTDGQPGAFDVTVQAGADQIVLRVGAIVAATGWRPYDASKLMHLGYGMSPDVVTNVELKDILAGGPLLRPSDAKPVGSVVFVQCAGSRDPDHLPYCSTVCCMTTLVQTGIIHQRNPDSQVFIFYKDIRTPGTYERFYRHAQDHPLNFFAKGDVTSVERRTDGKLRVTAKNTTFGESVAIDADLVVLATGMVSNSADRCLRLSYRQGPELPALRDGFPDSHFICFPYETRRTGIYAAGALRAPMDSAQARLDGMGAAFKAIQSVELAARGVAVHPRAGDASYPSFSLQRCTQCKRCTEECPFGALDEDAKGTPKPNLYRCRRCGVCMGACPERIVSFKNYSVDIIASMIKAIEVPDEDEEKTRILAFLCENDAYPALDIAGCERRHYDSSVRVIPLRCLGSLNIVWIADALSRGIDGILLVGCKYGDNYQCHFATGSELAARRLDNVKETLQRLQLEPERLQLTQLAINEWDRLPRLFDDFAERVRALGPNPYKGF